LDVTHRRKTNTPKKEPQTFRVYAPAVNEKEETPKKKGSTKKHRETLYITHI
jgi:hypothetical protein